MIRSTIAATAIAALSLTGCATMTVEEEEMLGAGLIGAAVGVVTAKVLDADDDWVIIAGLAGAAIGTLVARNNQTGQCAYARGDGTYRIARCP